MYSLFLLLLLSSSARSKAYECGCLIAAIPGSNPAEGMSLRLLCLLCVVQAAASATG